MYGQLTARLFPFLDYRDAPKAKWVKNRRITNLPHMERQKIRDIYSYDKDFDHVAEITRIEL